MMQLTAASSSHMVKLYKSYQKITTMLVQYNFINAFFMLLNLAVDVNLDWFVGTKFLHSILSILVLKMWDQAHYPFFQYKITKELYKLHFYSEERFIDNNNNNNNNHHSDYEKVMSDKLRNKYLKLAYIAILNISLIFVILTVLDIAIFTFFLIPKLWNLYDLDLDHDDNNNNEQNTTSIFIYSVVISVDLIQIILGILTNRVIHYNHHMLTTTSSSSTNDEGGE